MSELANLNRRRQNLMFRLTGMLTNIKGLQNEAYTKILYKEEVGDLKIIEKKLNRILRQQKKTWEYIKKNKL